MAHPDEADVCFHLANGYYSHDTASSAVRGASGVSAASGDTAAATVDAVAGASATTTKPTTSATKQRSKQVFWNTHGFGLMNAREQKAFSGTTAAE